MIGVLINWNILRNKSNKNDNKEFIVEKQFIFFCLFINRKIINIIKFSWIIQHFDISVPPICTYFLFVCINKKLDPIH